MSEMFTKCNGFIVSGDPLVYADSATMTGQGTVSEPFGVKSTDLLIDDTLQTGVSGNSAYIGVKSVDVFVQEPLYTGVSGDSAYIGWNNETVLWSGYSTGSSPTFNLSDNISNYEYIEMYAVEDDGWCGYTKTPTDYFTTANRISISIMHFGVQTKNVITRGIYVHPTSDTYLDGKSFGFDYSNNATENDRTHMTKIVGINRKV